MRTTHGPGGGWAAAPLHLLRRSSLRFLSSLRFPISFSLLALLSSILFFPLPARSADDVVVPNEQLVLDGIPPIPKEGHGFSKKKNQDFQFYAGVKFVEDNLLR